MFHKSTFLTLFFVLSLASCTSNKPKNDPDSSLTDDTVVSTTSNNEDTKLELKGDSDSGTAGGLQTVYFPFDSSELEDSSRDTLKANAEYLKANTNVSVQIEGHCDERGGIQYNLALGERRSKAIKEYLVALGVEKKRISTLSYGKEKPVAFGHDESAWGRNRRGTFVVTAK